MRDYLQIHLVVLAWGFTSILGKLIRIPAVEVTIWRTGIAALLLIVIARILGVNLRVTRKDLLPMLGTGMLIGVHWALFFLSARLATASVCLAAMPTIMIWCSILEPMIRRSWKWSWVELVVGAVVVGAVWMIYQVEMKYWQGFTVGLISAVFAAVFSVINKSLTMQHHPVRLCAWQMIGACGTCVALLPVLGSGRMSLPDWPDVGWLLILALVCTVGAYIGYLDVLRRISVFSVNVVYNLEPVYGILMASLFLGQSERMSAGFYGGAGIIMIAVLGLPWLNRWTGGRVRKIEIIP
ncbi:MAG: DMT family transporter [Verrucomicrobiae bacterium]|nr:DMT family transporter [Verrucomicrobiae bacterium]